MSPLFKRLPRQFKHDIGKYAGIFILLFASVAIVSGFLMASSSIQTMMATSHEDYAVEDGRFTTNFKASQEAIGAVEALGMSVYELFSSDIAAHIDADGTAAVIRVYRKRTDVDLAAYSSGVAPDAPGQIALDRCFADNHGISVGDTITLAGETFEVCGIMVLPDYSALFENNSDFVFNALTFCVAEVSPEQFELISADPGTYAIDYTYAFMLDDRSADLAARTEIEKEIVRVLNDNDSVVIDFVDWESNQGITYALSDAEGDSVMWQVFYYIIIVIMAFVFSVLSSSAIEAESSQIGTLEAMGYTKRELIAHYVALPALIGLAGVALGSVVGYCFVLDPMKDLYYNSYSLAPFELQWDWSVFLLTSVLPYVMLVGLTLVFLVWNLRATPVQFLRHERGQHSHAKGIGLPESMSFTARFRLRLLTRNAANCIVLFFGIAFANLLLLFGTCVMPTIEHYAELMSENLVAEHQYMLKVPLEINVSAEEVETFADIEEYLFGDRDSFSTIDLVRLEVKAKPYEEDGAVYVNTSPNSDEAIEQAEKYAVYTLKALRAFGGQYEDVSVYGILPDSAYWDGLDVGDGAIFMSAGLSEKCAISVGDTVTFEDAYTGNSYELTISGIWGSRAGIALYMAIDDFNELFGNASTYFNGYVSNMELNFQARYVYNDLTAADMDKIVDQLVDSVGDIISIIQGLAIVIYLVLMYLLTKTILERSTHSISLMKIFGYTSTEIRRLYINTITADVLVSLVLTTPLVIWGLVMLCKLAFMEYAGNIVAYTPAVYIALSLVAALVAYGVVACIHLRLIRRVSFGVALKAQE